MSPAGIFAMGVLVTLILGSGLSFLVYGAILDGRTRLSARPPRQSERRSAPTATVPTRPSCQNLVGTARGAGSSLAARGGGCRRARLPSAGPATVFAPRAAGFSRSPAGTIKSLLEDTPNLVGVITYHVVRGRITASDAVAVPTAATVRGDDLTISVNGGIGVAGARVVSTDIEASNGLIHVIDRVLLPQPPESTERTSCR